jgi:tetratricopeptide (TPR) repeat protein
LDQGAVISEFSEFLLELARHHPLLLMLDDLHWADDASLTLLFHLSRRLSSSRILIVGAYRPEALADGLGRKRHLLKEVLTELQRTYGHIFIDIETKEQSESRKFIDALLDSEPNQLSRSFRDAFFQKTGGHPLFCVELLHEMQERGDLVQNEAGEWHVGDSLDWLAIPARVEAVIGQRLGHLDAAIRGTLQAASVEGETFTAEIIAEVCQFDKRELVAIFSRDLIRQQRLLITQGIEQMTPERQLTRYRFKHHLFQAYLYNELDEIERSYLHEAVGVALENLYGDHTDEIADQLARHFQEAHNLPKGIKYLLLAGERATRLFAYEEAIAGFQHALEMVPNLPQSPETNQQLFRLYMGLGLAQRKAGVFENSLHSFQKAAGIAREQGSVEELAQAALAYEESRWRVNLPPATSVALLTEALHNLGETNRILQARVWVNRAWALMPISSPDQAERLLQQALEMARQVNDPLVLFDALYLNVRRNRRPESSSERMEMLADMLSLAETLGSFERIGDIYAFRLLEHLERGDIDSFTGDEQYFASQLSKKIHQPFYEYDAIINTVLMTMLAGHFEVAERLVGEALEKGRQMGVENYDGVCSMQMFTIRREQGRLRELAPLVRLIISQNAEASVWKPGLALLYVELDMRSEAQAVFEGLAENEFDALPRDALWVTSLVYLSEVCAYLGDAERATILYRLLSNYNGRNVVVGHKTFCLGAAARYLGLLAATMFDVAAAELHFEDAITMNERMGAHSWLAHTRYDYAALLLAQGQPIDKTQAEALLGESLSSAEALGMHALVEKIETLKGNF